MEENQADEQEDEQSLSFSVDHFANWQELVASGAISVPRARTRRGLAPQRPKAKRRKNQDLAGDCGGRVIRSDARKDRHSKVCTARGTRDRRVRLSPETAILFYDVQDRLGYDRPSKAIDWLMREAKAAIDALENDPPPQPADRVCFASAGFMGSCSGVPVNLEIQQFGPEDNAGLSNNGGFGFIADEYQQAFSPLAPLTVSSDGIFEANMELGKMQRIFAWNNNGNGSLQDHFAGPAPSMMGRGQISREPLPSNYSRIAGSHYPMSPRFPIFDFSDDPLLDFTTPEENDVGNLYKIPVSGEQSSPASFLHYEE